MVAAAEERGEGGGERHVAADGQADRGGELPRVGVYAGLTFNVILTWDAIVAFDFGGHIGVGVGTGVLVINAVLLWLYSLSCYACRQGVGGRINHFTKL